MHATAVRMYVHTYNSMQQQQQHVCTTAAAAAVVPYVRTTAGWFVCYSRERESSVMLGQTKQLTPWVTEVLLLLFHTAAACMHRTEGEV